MVPITAEQLDSLAPRAKAFYRDAFVNGADVLAKYGSTTRRCGWRILWLRCFMRAALWRSPRKACSTQPPHGFATSGRRAYEDRRRTVHEECRELRELRVRRSERHRQRPAGRRLPFHRPRIDSDHRPRFVLRFGQKLGADLIADPKLAFSQQWCLPLAAEEWTQKVQRARRRRQRQGRSRKESTAERSVSRNVSSG